MKKVLIKKIVASEILDSRGNPTVQAKVYTDSCIGVAEVPSGASTGTHEALELRDKDQKRYNGLGVLTAVSNINNQIANVLVGSNVLEQRSLDSKMLELDGTENKSRLGANAILAVSMAATRAASQAVGMELYNYLATLSSTKPKVEALPMCNIINGGAHADSGLDLQEVMIIPKAATFRERIRIASEIYHALKVNLKKAKMVTAVGDEGGFAPHLPNNESSIKEIIKAIKIAGYKEGKDVNLGLDVASSEFYDSKDKVYNLKAENKKLNSKQLLKVYEKWLSKYPIISIEDGFAEDDFEAWKAFTKEYGKKTIIVGDDLFVTNVKRLKIGIDEKLANAILIKVNQIGTVTETLSAIELAQKNNFKVAVSHRSGETSDTFISDLAVAVGADFIKAGSLSRGERIAKYNRLMEIESVINGSK